MHSLADALESFNRKERNLLVRAMLAEGGLEAGLLRAGFAGFAAAPLPSSHRESPWAAFARSPVGESTARWGTCDR
jgi:hypothetical protein